jgi:mRNA interferase RelE/StbE
MAYSVEFTATAEKQLDKFPDATRRRLIEAISRLGENPRHTGTKKLSGEEGFYRTRSGDYRIVYRIEDNRLLVLVVKIGHRREVYR